MMQIGVAPGTSSSSKSMKIGCFYVLLNLFLNASCLEEMIGVIVGAFVLFVICIIITILITRACVKSV